ncbi:hypothetical protein BH10BAC5_BH10BAC5_20520 [soil metagenome]
MDIKNKKVLILGGWGLVGSAIARRLMPESPSKIILTSLKKEEAEEICAELSKEYKKKPGFFVPWHGNIFSRHDYKDTSRDQLLEDDVTRSEMVKDIAGELNDKMLNSMALFRLIKDQKPDVIIDCINTATAIAYQNIFNSYNTINGILNGKDQNFSLLKKEVEKMMCISYVPQLIRHIQVLHNSMLKFNVKFYLKIGTSGTGGMGLNIPYTHSEEKPSRVLLSKSSVAGAHTLLLFLMARTPGGPAIKELKPTASIAWKKIAYGEVKKYGKPINIYEAGFNEAISLDGKFKRISDKKFKTSKNLNTVFIDTGENGIFSAGEFETISTVGQMEFVTPEEIAENSVREIQGFNTGHDIIHALDSSAMEPSYRAGFLQQYASNKIKALEKENKTSSIAFEMLGPPRLSKLLFEVHLIRLIYKNFNDYINENSKKASNKIYELLKKNSALRNEIISIGIPILLPDGKSLLRGPQIEIPSRSEGEEFELDAPKIEKWAANGWVDLREKNWKLWNDRFKAIIKDTNDNNDSAFSSRFVFNKEYWENFESINIGKIVGWLFINEEEGLRIKG